MEEVSGGRYEVESRQRTKYRGLRLKNVFNTSISGDADFDNLMTQGRLMKNVVVLGLGVMFVYTSFKSLAFIQSSLNHEAGLGTTSLAIIFGTLIFSSLFIPSAIIGLLGKKWTVAVSMIGFIVYICANMHPVGYIIYPSAALAGLGAAPMWSAQSAYLTQLATWYSNKTGKTTDSVVSLFFGIFFAIFQTATVWGNIISSVTLTRKPDNVSEDSLDLCGPRFCPATHVNNTYLERPPEIKVYILLGAYIFCAMIGVIVVALFLDRIDSTNQIKDYSKNTGKKGVKSMLTMRLFAATFKHFWESRPQKLLVPLTVFCGIEIGFLVADYTASYIGCSSGIWNVGYVMISYGATASVSSFLCGRLTEYLGFLFFFVFGALNHLAVLVGVLFWVPEHSTFYLLFIVAALLGMTDAIWQTETNALYGHLFRDRKEAAFCNMRLWRAVGQVLSLGYYHHLCQNIKIYICISFLIVGMVGYLIVELQTRYHQRRYSYTEIDGDDESLDDESVDKTNYSSLN